MGVGFFDNLLAEKIRQIVRSKSITSFVFIDGGLGIKLNTECRATKIAWLMELGKDYAVVSGKVGG